jgi:hypothetical protein
MPWSRQIWFFLVLSALAGSQVHWWIFAPAVVEISLTSTRRVRDAEEGRADLRRECGRQPFGPGACA